jgi:ERCC4-related helicase
VTGVAPPEIALIALGKTTRLPQRAHATIESLPSACDTMSDSEDYGNEFDDTEIFNAATQVERENTPAFLPSPRAAKRRKISQAQANEKPAPISSVKRSRPQQGPFILSDDDSGADVDAASEESHSGADGEYAADARSKTAQTRSAAGRKSIATRNQQDDDEEKHASPARATAAQKRKERIHIPTAKLDMTDVYFTQPPQEHSPPWKPRGAIWAKPTTSIGVHQASSSTKQVGTMAAKSTAAPGRQSMSSRPNAPAVLSLDEPDSPIEIDASPILPTTTVTYDFTDDLADLPSDAFASSSSSPQKQYGSITPESRKRVVAPLVGLRQTTLFGRQGVTGEVAPSQLNKRYNYVVDQKQEKPTHHKLDREAMKTWVYPTNLGTIRDYQFNIVQRGLFHNLLVALPTGLGKTFIAATIMLNWYRWTTEAQIVFVAPTKPLVSQQVGACFGIAGIPRSATTMLTGGVTTALRAQEWKDKRVFFMTPQTLLNDLKSGYADPKNIVLLVVDEAHRATGSYAYVEVVSFLRRFNTSFRVLALTATPGADVEAVQKVIDGLDISKVEIRTENSMDIEKYVHQRRIEKHVFKNSEEMEMCMDLYSAALQPLVNVVHGMGVLWSADPRKLTPYGCNQSQAKWNIDAGRNANQGQKGIARSIMAILASIAHGMDLLKYYGMGPFYTKMKDFKEESTKTKSKYKKQILDSDAFKKLMTRLDSWMHDANFAGHPKLEFVQECILDHFVNADEASSVQGASASTTRIMVFAHFRDSAEEIVRVLKKHEPMIRPRVFVGQSTAKNSDGMNQKEQLEVIEKFKSGTYNTLIATSIGEEGLDIGEVDLIICYDSKASPIRMLQRMGRTGRKREGKIIMLQMQGKEEDDANKAKDSYEKMQELIAKGTSFNFHDDMSHRIVPADIKPVVDRRVVEIPPENSQQDWLPEPKRKGRMKKPPKKFHMPDGVLTGFVTAGRMDEEIVPKSRAKKAAPIYPSEEMFEFPPLESVLLDDLAAKELERRFQTVFDDTDAPVISDLDLSRFPESQRTLADTEFLAGPGRATRAFVGTMQRIHAMDSDCLDVFKQNLHYSDCEPDTADDVLVSDAESRPVIQEHMWEEDSASELPPAPKARAKADSKPKAKPGPKPKAKTDPTTIPKTPAPRGRPRKNVPATETPIRQSKAQTPTPKTKTPNWRVSALAGEGADSSPPPTDPRFRIASQADTIGSDDTVDREPEDTQAWKQDSELASFIIENEDEEEDIPPSSLPSLDLSGIGRGTQAVLKAARPKRAPRAEKLFTSDPTDDDAIVSSDSDDDAPLTRLETGVKRKPAVVVDSSSQEDEPVVRRQRVRRVIDEDEDDDEDDD